MEFRILGPLEVLEEGRPVALGGAKQRALLAVLLLHANEVVSRDRLIDELWGGEPPDTAHTALQVHVSQLRKLLGRDTIVTQTPGYLIRVSDGELDLHRFERLVATARAEEPAQAARLLREGLALWRGAPLAELGDSSARAERARLEEQRLAALAQRIEAELALGRHAELVPELEGLVREQPLRERLRGQLMLALYRCGRQADALEVYRTGRRLLDEELGLKPDDELQRLERAILNHDPSLESPVVAGVKRPSVPQRRRASSHTEAPVPPDSVAVIDLQRSRVVGHVLVGRRPVAVAIGHGSVWVANADDGTVSRIDQDRREVIRTIGIGAPAIDLAVATDAVWVANGSDGTVSRIDPSADAVVETIDLRGSSELVWNPTYAVDADDDSVWIAAGPHHVLRIDPSDERALGDHRRRPGSGRRSTRRGSTVGRDDRRAGSAHRAPHEHSHDRGAHRVPRRVDGREAGCLGLRLARPGLAHQPGHGNGDSDDPGWQKACGPVRDGWSGVRSQQRRRHRRPDRSAGRSGCGRRSGWPRPDGRRLLGRDRLGFDTEASSAM